MSDQQREAHIRARSQETAFGASDKRGPGCYEVRAVVGSEMLVVRFKTERDADRFWRAAIRGVAIVV